MKTQTVCFMRLFYVVVVSSLNIVIFWATNAQAQNLQVLHSFAGGDDGANPSLGDLVYDGSALYGMTYNGGDFNEGVVFRMQPTGDNYSILHTFRDATDQGGATPAGSLFVDGSTLYGMTTGGGNTGQGVLFSMQSDGTGFTVLHSFDDLSEGVGPTGSIIKLANTLYGMTPYGGLAGGGFREPGYNGIVFAFALDSVTYRVVHAFAADQSEGVSPVGSLVTDGTTLYAMTGGGGDFGGGTIFSVNVDGSSFRVLRSLDWPDGVRPRGSLILIGSKLYGLTTDGGPGDSYGTAFSMNTDGSDFRVLHAFPRDRSEGLSPQGSLLLLGSTLYGLTPVHGAGDHGTLFSLQSDGSDFHVLHAFSADGSEGSNANGSLIRAGSSLFGLTESGGAYNKGTIFRFSLEDLDGDGTPDAEDECPNSDIQSTIFIGDVDTRVQNDLVDRGCSLADLIQETLSNDPSTEELVQFLLQLRSDGTITGQEMGAILRAINGG